MNHELRPRHYADQALKSMREVVMTAPKEQRGAITIHLYSALSKAYQKQKAKDKK